MQKTYPLHDILPQFLSTRQSAERQPKRVRETAELAGAIQLLNSNGLEIGDSEKQFQFHIDESANRPVINVLDRNTGEVLYQIPAEAVIRAAVEIRRNLQEKAKDDPFIDGFV